MSGGFGSGKWGGVPWGSADSDGGSSFVDNVAENVSVSESLSVDQPATLAEAVAVSEALTVLHPYKVTAAASQLSFLVRVDFSSDLDPGYPPNFDPANYPIAGLTVIAVSPHPTLSNSVLILTSEQDNVSYTVIVSTAVRSTSGDYVTPPFRTATFLGSAVPPSFQAVAQSRTKIRLSFVATMSFDVSFSDTSNYTVARLDGTPVGIVSVSPILDGTLRRGEIILSEELEPLGYYTVTIGSAVRTTANQPLSPAISMFQWKEHVPAPIFIKFENFSGEVSGGLLGSPDGQVFFSPAYDAPVVDSVIQVDEVKVCTRAYDVYQIPSLPDPPVLFTFPAPNTAAAGGLLNGAVLFGTAERLGLARVSLSDFQEDAVAAPVDGPCDATLVETIDITSGGFLNDIRWQTFPAATASIGVFTTAANLAPIGPGPTTNINLQP